jgi:hypothetical protein
VHRLLSLYLPLLGVGLALAPPAASAKAASAPQHPAQTSKELLARCAADEAATPRRHRCFLKVQKEFTRPVTAPINCKFGWRVGKDHPDPALSMPSGDHVLDGLDQCAYFHDKGSFRYNPITRFCEHIAMCASTVSFFRCVKAWEKAAGSSMTAEEKEATACVLDSLFHTGYRACSLGNDKTPLYRDYDFQFVHDQKRGGFWLGPGTVKKIVEAKNKCTNPDW